MEARTNALKASWLHLVLLAFVLTSMASECSKSISLLITRQNNGDIFTGVPGDSKTRCTAETCVGISSGTAAAVSADMCTCQCHSHLPVFREDLKICVDDIHECVLAPFVGGTTSQHIPFVYLPLKGQIIHPGKAIALSGLQKPVCAVTGARYMTEDSWVDLRNPVDSDVPFRLIKDEGRTFLQWNGEPDLRNKMSGRLVSVNLMCRDMSMVEATDIPRVQMIFSPCVAFRIVGTPAKQMSNVSEVAFIQDPSAEANNKENDSMSVPEYIAIGICSVLLGLIYVASVFLYLHLRKRSKSNSIASDEKSARGIEEGIVKSNPLLSLTSHFIQNDQGYSDENSSDNDAPDIIKHFEDRKKHVISAMVHPEQMSFNSHRSTFSSFEQLPHQDSATNERLPEENVSITETLENREDRPDNLRALTGTTRKKLYFNPAYFDPQLLLTPPPAAIEFLTKIREVISVAKQKLNTKKFTPSLLNIPEEESHYPVDSIYGLTNPISRRSSIISLKRVNSRRRTCTGCPGCEPQELTGIIPDIPSPIACQSCTISSNESKQISIRKWLEDVPVLKDATDHNHNEVNPKRLRSPTRSLPPDDYNDFNSGSDAALVPYGSARSSSFHGSNKLKPKINKRARKQNLPSAPPTPSVTNPTKEENYYDTVPSDISQGVLSPSLPPDMIQEAMAIERFEEKIATLTKEQMNAVINEFTIHKNLISPVEEHSNVIADYETDSLERSGHKGYSTPSEYAEVSSSQPSPSLSTSLPVQEEMTIRNAMFNKETGDPSHSPEEEHDYELIVLRRGSLVEKNSSYNLPKFLQSNNGYSLVSEVYVNSGYNFSSAPSTPGGSRYSTLDKNALKVRYEEGPEKPGKLLIEVEDCADHYIPVHESDEYEPDTLERKPSKIKRDAARNVNGDSLGRCDSLVLRSGGSFRSVAQHADMPSGNFNRAFGSLREIYEAKNSGRRGDGKFVACAMTDEEKGRMLTLEERHSRRQRSRENLVQPDVIPPPPHISPIYEQPKPPRRVVELDTYPLPPLPSKNALGRSAASPGAGTPASPPSALLFGHPKFNDGKRREDSGYLSSDSESLCDGRSESGAESVETHSVFFGRPCRVGGSMDSGLAGGEEGHSGSDSETVGYATVVAVPAGAVGRKA